MITDPLNPCGNSAPGIGLLSPDAARLDRVHRATRVLSLLALVSVAGACGLLFVAIHGSLPGVGSLACEWSESKARPVASPRLILISFDGFRWDYLGRSQVKAPWLRRFRDQGTHAERMIPVFPSKTFPNHYSIVTGLYPPWHGIVDNSFCFADWTPCFRSARFACGSPNPAAGRPAYAGPKPESSSRSRSTCESPPRC